MDSVDLSTWKRQMMALGAAQTLLEFYAKIHALNALLADGIDGTEYNLIIEELNKRSVSETDLRNVLKDFENMFFDR